MIQIWRYNRRFYLSTLGAVLLGCFAAPSLPPWPRALLLGGSALALFWTVASLAVSHYVYDRSPLYDFAWMPARVGTPLSAIVNLHAGLDQSSELLRAQFPEARLRIFDIFDSGEMPEPSIAQARALAGRKSTAEPADWRSLPAETGEFRAAFVIFTAHELRRSQARLHFFRELARVTRAGGAIVLLEHLRDLPNFLAFGPGFLHFFGRGEWLLAAEEAALRLESEFCITPFVRVFVFRR